MPGIIMSITAASNSSPPAPGERLLARGAGGHLHAPALGVQGENRKIRLVVVDHEQAACPAASRRSVSLRPHAGRRRADGEDERRAAPHFARRPKSMPPMSCTSRSQMTRPRPVPPVRARGRGVDLAEDLEKQVHLVVRNADAGVLHRETDLPQVAHLLAGRGLVQRRQRRGPSPRGKPRPRSVNLMALPTRLSSTCRRRWSSPMRLAGRSSWTIWTRSRCFSRALGASRSSASSTQERRSKGNSFELQPARLDLGEVEDVVDDGEERFAAGAQGLDVLVLRGRELRLEQQAGHADDAVHRRADFVAHVGEELGLGAVAGLGHVLGLDELVLVLAALGDVAPGQGVDELAVDLGCDRRRSPPGSGGPGARWPRPRHRSAWSDRLAPTRRPARAPPRKSPARRRDDRRAGPRGP